MPLSNSLGRHARPLLRAGLSNMGKLSANANLAADLEISGLKVLISWRLHRASELLYSTTHAYQDCGKSSPPPMLIWPPTLRSPDCRSWMADACTQYKEHRGKHSRTAATWGDPPPMPIWPLVISLKLPASMSWLAGACTESEGCITNGCHAVQPGLTHCSRT